MPWIVQKLDPSDDPAVEAEWMTVAVRDRKRDTKPDVDALLRSGYDLEASIEVVKVAAGDPIAVVGAVDRWDEHGGDVGDRAEPAADAGDGGVTQGRLF